MGTVVCGGVKEPLTPAQARTLLEHVKDHRLGGLVSVGTALGLRMGEALGLRWQDVDLDAGMLSVRQALERSGGGMARPADHSRSNVVRYWPASEAHRNGASSKALRLELEALRMRWRDLRTTVHFVEPKSTRSRRTIRLPQVVIGALRSHRTRQRIERLAAGGEWTDSGLVFTTVEGTSLDARNVTREFQAVLTAAGVPRVRFHDLRHTAATLLLSQGVDPRTIMQTLGHSQISLTLNTYSHVMPALQIDAAAKLDAVFSR